MAASCSCIRTCCTIGLTQSNTSSCEGTETAVSVKRSFDSFALTVPSVATILSSTSFIFLEPDGAALVVILLCLRRSSPISVFLSLSQVRRFDVAPDGALVALGSMDSGAYGYQYLPVTFPRNEYKATDVRPSFHGATLEEKRIK